MSDGLGPRLRRWARVLTFRAGREELDRLDRNDLALGLAATWLVGMGRYWDDPDARLLQHLGLGSVVYVFALSLLLWLVIWPLGPRRGWSYEKVLTFVALVAPPAILYAIPVERFLALEIARSVNVWFLATVAAWRVALLVHFLRVAGGLPAFRIAVGSLLPLTLLVAALAALNLERAVFRIMGGLRGGTANDGAYLVLLVITFFSTWAFAPLLIAYVSLVTITVRRRRAEASGG